MELIQDYWKELTVTMNERTGESMTIEEMQDKHKVGEE